MKSDVIFKKYLTAENAEIISAIARHQENIFSVLVFSGAASLLFVFLGVLSDLRGERLCFFFD